MGLKANPGIDLSAKKSEIVGSLGESGVKRLYERWGVEFTQEEASENGWLECKGLRLDGEEDRRPSAAINLASGLYKDSGTGELLSIFDFALTRLKLSSFSDALSLVAKEAGVDVRAIPKHQGAILESTHDYLDADGNLERQILKYRLKDGSKSFTQRRLDSKGGWIYKVAKSRYLPYRLPELLKALPSAPVFYCEGEKDADLLASLGFIATTHAGGTGNTDKASGQVAPYFNGRIVYVLADNDDTGRLHARTIAEALAPLANVVKIIELPNLPPKGDVSDWLASGNYSDDLEEFCKLAPPFSLPKAESASELGEVEWSPPRLRQEVEAVPFPFEVLPSDLSRLVEDISLSVQAPNDHAAVACLAVAGAAIGNAVHLQIKPGYSEHPGGYWATIGPPGRRKTATIRYAASPLYRLDKQFIRKYEDAQKAFTSGENKGKNKEEPPKLREMIVSDITMEALAKVLQQNPRGVLSVHDELAAWISSRDKYRGGKGDDHQQWLSIWAGSTLKVNRKGGAKDNGFALPLVVSSPCVTVLGPLTPDNMSLLSSNKDDGAFDRILFSMPDYPPLEDWTDHAPSPEGLEQWDSAIARLVALPVCDPIRHVRFTNPARAAFVRKVNALRAETRNTRDFPSRLVGPWSKLEGYLARISLILHCLYWAYEGYKAETDGPPYAIEEGTVKQAVKIIDYFKVHHWRAQNRLSKEGMVPADAKAILDYCRNRINASPLVTQREIRKNFKRFREDTIALQDAIAWLLKASCLRPTTSETGGVGRPPSPTYLINPALLQEESNENNATCDDANTDPQGIGDE